MKTQLQAWIDGDIKERAKELRINMSQVCEKALREEVQRVEKKMVVKGAFKGGDQ